MINLCCYNYCSGMSLGEYFLFLKACHQQKASYQTQKKTYLHILLERFLKILHHVPNQIPAETVAVMLSRKKEEYKPNEVTILLKHSVGSRHAPLSVSIMTEAIINIVAAHLLFCHRVSVNTWPWSQHYQAVPQHSVQYYM